MRRASLAAALLALAALAVPAAPAMAHADLVSSDPADGATLAAPPDAVSLTFSEALLEETVDVAIESGGEVVASDAVQAEGATVLVPWPAAAASGDYSVNFRVVSADGHPIEGSVSFTIAGSAPSASPVAASAAPVDAAATSASAVPTEFETSDEVNWPFVVVIMVLGTAGFATLLIASRAAREKRRR